MTAAEEQVHRWQPLSVDDAASVFDALGVRWWIAGGVAVDLFVGHPTRPHGDLDIAMLRRDHERLRALLDDWEVCIAHDGALTPWTGDALDEDQHQFWVRRRGETEWNFEVLLEDATGETWLYRRNHRVAMGLDDIGRRSADGHPYLIPGITLLYKARSSSDFDRNARDFAVAAPLLAADERAWLLGALTIAHPDHPWIAALGQ